MTNLRDELLRFVSQLRGAGVRISIAETLDAMNAISAAGLERAPMREALAATVIKDEDDRHIFDDLFARFFAGGREPSDDGLAQARQGVVDRAGLGPHRERIDPLSSQGPETVAIRRQREEANRARNRRPNRNKRPRNIAKEKQRARIRAGRKIARRRRAKNRAKPATNKKPRSPPARMRGGEKSSAPRSNDYSDLEFDEARDALAPIARRFRVRLGRRLRMAKTGRLDFRRTIRASIQRGGALSDLRFRARRPRHIDLVILADISGSVRYSSTLMLELIAGAAKFFRRVRSFVFHRSPCGGRVRAEASGDNAAARSLCALGFRPRARRTMGAARRAAQSRDGTGDHGRRP